ncbi:MAG: hypothetical protein AB1847_16695 [bacterium]
MDDLSRDELEEEGITPLTEDLTGTEYYPVLPDGSVSSEPEKLMPPEGFAVNPGKVAWEPDLSKLSDEERKLFERAYEQRFGPVRTMGQLNDRLNGLQENFKLMGVDAVPVKKFGFESDANGKWDQVNGIIKLNPIRYIQVETAVKEGKITSLEQADSLATLCHEFGHSLGVQIDTMRYNDRNDTSYRNLSQIVNEVWERFFFPDFCKAMNLQDVDQYAEQIFQVRDSLYQPMVKNFMRLMESAGMDRQQLSDLVWNLNLSHDPDQYEKLIRDKIQELVPGVTLPADKLGTGMNVSEKCEQWLDVIGQHMKALGKDKGKIL